MNLKLSIPELSEVLQILHPVVPSRSTRPILSHILFEPVDTRVQLTATDLEVGVRCFLEEVRVVGTGKMVLPAGRLSAISRELKLGELTLESDDKGVDLKSGDVKFRLPRESEEDFPELDFTAKYCGSLESVSLVEMIRKTCFATATERSRYAINGVHIVADDGQLTLTATDGRRLANISEKISGELGPFTAIVPARALTLLQKIVSLESPEKIKIEINDNQIVFQTPRSSVMARLIAGKFPDYKNVIPKKPQHVLEIEKNILEKAVRTAALVTNEESKTIRMSFSPGKMTVSARTHSLGESIVEEKVDYEGDDLEIRFNPVFLLEGLKVCDSQRIRLGLKDPNTAGLLEEVSGSGYKYVLTPINIVS